MMIQVSIFVLELLHQPTLAMLYALKMHSVSIDTIMVTELKFKVSCINVKFYIIVHVLLA